MADQLSAKVLVADDDDQVRALLVEYLTTHGCEVLQAANGLEALLHVKRQLPRAVIMDVAMPRLGGLEAVKRIRAFNPRIRIVVITGLTDPRVDDDARALGVASVLHKPLNLADVLIALGGDPPVPERPPVMVPVPPRTPTGFSSAWARGSLLLVDDDDAYREMLEELLTSKGYATRSVADASTALRMIEQAPPDVILLDIEMPRLNGIEALPAIRVIAPRTLVVMVSGTLDVAMARRALTYGAFDYVTKPIDIVYLTRSIDAALMTKMLDADDH